METREIYIASTKTQKRYKINTDATTLGELKSVLDNQGIDYAGMTFTEGISKTQLTSDDSQLPTNVMRKGVPTNNLVIILTNTTKNIASGALSRKEIYAIIKEHKLQEDLKAAFGNWTIISTDVLEEFITNNYNILDKDESDEEDNNEEDDNDETWATNPETVNWFYEGIKRAVKAGALDTDDIIVLSDYISEYAADLKKEDKMNKIRQESEVTDAETNGMIDDILAGI